MAMVSIGSTFNGRNLTLLRAYMPMIDENDYAVRIPRSEFNTLSTELVLAVLDRSVKAPTELAQIDRNKIIAPLLQEMDIQFRAAQIKYERGLADASLKDSDTMKGLKKSHTVKSYNGLYGWAFALLEWTGINYRSEEFVRTEGSAHRVKWLFGVEKDENERLNRIKGFIPLALRPLIDQLKELKERDQVDMDILKQAQQMRDVFKSIFPTVPLMVDGHPVDLAEFEPPSDI